MTGFLERLRSGEAQIGDTGNSNDFLSQLKGGRLSVEDQARQAKPPFTAGRAIDTVLGSPPVGAMEGLGNILAGAALWMPSQAGKFGTIAADKFANLFLEDIPPEEVLERGRKVEEAIATLGGLLPGPQTEAGQAVVEPVSKALETILTPGKKAVEAIVPEEYPNLRELGTFASELATFKIAHVGASKVKSRIKKIQEKAKSNPAEADSLAREALAELKEEEYKPLRTALERQKAIEEAIPTEKPSLAKDAKMRQQVIDRMMAEEPEVPGAEIGAKLADNIGRYYENLKTRDVLRTSFKAGKISEKERLRETEKLIEKLLETKPEEPVKPIEKPTLKISKEDKPIPLTRRGQEEVARRNLGAKSHEEVRQAIQAQLNKNITKPKPKRETIVKEEIKEVEPEANEAELNALETVLRERFEQEQLTKAGPPEILENIKRIDKEIQEGKADYKRIEGELEFLLDAAEGTGDSMMVEGVGMGLEKVRSLARKQAAEKENLYKPKPVEGDPELQMAKHPIKDVDVIYTPEGSVFESPLDAVDFMRSKGLKGRVDSFRDGYLIELREPEPIKFSEKYGERVEAEGRKARAEMRELDRIDKEFLEATKTRWQRVYDVVEKFLKDETGAVIVPPEAVAKVKKVAERASQAGKTLREYLTTVGFNEKEIKKFEEAVRGLDNPKSAPKPTGEPINTGRMVRKTRDGHEIKRPVVTEEMGKELMEAREFKRSESKFKIARDLEGFFREMAPTVFKLDETGSKYLKDLQNRIWELKAESEAEFKEVNQKLKALTKGLGKKSMDRIGTRAHWEQKEIRGRLKAKGVNEEDIPILNKQEQRVYDFMRGELEKIADTTIEVMKNNNKKPYKKVKDYFTIMYSEGTNSIINSFNTLHDPASMQNHRYTQYSEKPFRFQKKRSYKGLDFDMKTNAKNVFNTYMRNAIEYKNTLPLLAEMKEIRKPLKTGKKVLKDGKMIDETFTLGKEKPNLDTFLRRLANQLAGRDPEAWMNTTRGGVGRMDQRIRKAANNIAGSMMSGLARSGIIQISALRNTIPEAGWINTAKGVMDMTNLGKIRQARRESAFLRTSLSDAELSDIFKGGTFGKTRRALTSHIKYMDLITRMASYNAFKRTLAKQGFKGKDLIREAERLTAKTQASGLPTDIAPIQRSAVGKAMFLLQTFTINDWNFLYKEVFGADKKNMSLRRKGMKTFNYLMATALFNTLFEDVMQIDSPFPTPIKTAMRGIEAGNDNGDIINDVVLDMVSQVPGAFGSLRYNSSGFGLFVDTFDSLIEATRDEQYGKVIELGARVTGVPGTRQIAKSVGQLKKGEKNPYRVIMGRDPGAKEKKSRSGTYKF